jgi:hypothetical protein
MMLSEPLMRAGVGRVGAISFLFLGPGLAACVAPLAVVAFFGLIGLLFSDVGSEADRTGVIEGIVSTMSASVGMLAGSALGPLVLVGAVMLVIGWCASVAMLRSRDVPRPREFTLWAALLGACLLLPLALAVLFALSLQQPFDLLGSGRGSAVRLWLAFAVVGVLCVPLGALAWRLVARASPR